MAKVIIDSVNELIFHPSQQKIQAFEGYWLPMAGRTGKKSAGRG